MKITHLDLINYRNYAKERIDFNKDIAIIFGDNGQGKTNLIESIYLLGTSKPFRQITDQDLIKFSEDGFAIKGSIKKADFETVLAVEYTRVNGKYLFENNKRIGRVFDYIGKLLVTLFSPEDLNYIKGEASLRRKYIDAILCQTNSIYFRELIKYNKIIKNRNSLLRLYKTDRSKVNQLEPWNEQLIICADYIVNKRVEIINVLLELAESLSEKYKLFENIELKYSTFFDITAEGLNNYKTILKEQFHKIKEIEYIKGSTLCGPHRDDIVIDLNKKNSRFFSSQGEQRTASIILRMAEATYIHRIKGEHPLLLLDDIFSELDDHHRMMIMSLLDGQAQTFITGTRLADFNDLLSKADQYQIRNGRII
jgi:DNA replication and repair protein RecF